MTPRIKPAAFMAVSPPAFIPLRDRRGQTEARLARNVAVLFGVEAERSPCGLTWVCDYNQLTIKELGRGAPSEVEHADLDVIPTATLHRYGPETKAALILAAADQLFGSIEPTMRDVLGVLGTCDDGRPYADAMRATAWACLTSYAFQAQPALFVAAMHARTVQRASTSGWKPLLVSGYEALRSEFGDVESEVKAPRPRTLGIVDALMHEVVAPHSPVILESGSSEGGGPSDSFLTDSLIDRWTRHLVYSADSGIAIAVQDEGGHWLDAFVPHLAALASFAADTVGHYNLVVPFALDREGDGAVMEPFDKSREDHIARMIPRIPSLPETIKLPRTSQEALIGVIFHLIRVLRDGTSFNGPEMNRRCVAALERTTQLARSVLGPDAFVTMQAELGLARMTSIDVRDKGAAAAGDAADAVLERFDAVRIARSEGRLSMGDWIECVNSTSPRLNAIAQDLATSDQKQALATRSLVTADWDSVIDALGLASDEEQALKSENLPIALASITHNYFGFELRSEDLDRRLQALRLAREVTIPQRRIVAAQRGNDTAIRLSLQVALRGACNALPELQDSRRVSLLEDIESWTRQLADTSLALALSRGEVAPDAYLPSHVNLLTSLLSGRLVLAEQKRSPSPDAALFALLARAEVVASGVESFDDLSRESARVLEILDILDRFQRLTGIQVLQ